MLIYYAEIGDIDSFSREFGTAPNSYVCDALLKASENGHLNIVERILKNPNTVDETDQFYALGKASENGHLNIVERILKNPNVDPTQHYNLPFILAEENGHTSICDRLLQDKRVRNYEDLMIYTKSGDLDQIERLLTVENLDPSIGDNTAIFRASKYGHLHIVERLLQDKRVKADAFDNLPFRSASESGHLAIVDRLLRCDEIDPNCAASNAIVNNHKKVAARILSDRRVMDSGFVGIKEESIKELFIHPRLVGMGGLLLSSISEDLAHEVLEYTISNGYL